MSPDIGELQFKLNLSGQDIGALLGKLQTDIEMAMEPSDDNPANREINRALQEVEGRVRSQIEAALGAELVERFLAANQDLYSGGSLLKTEQRYEIRFCLSPRDVGLVLSEAEGALDDATLFLEEDPKGRENSRPIALSLLNMYAPVHRGIRREIGAALAADLEEQVDTLWSVCVDEIMHERNWQRPA